MTAKPSQRGNDDSEVLKFKDFQGSLTSNSKTFTPYSIFKDFPGTGKIGKKFQGLSRTFKAVWPPCTIPTYCQSGPKVTCSHPLITRLPFGLQLTPLGLAYFKKIQLYKDQKCG